MNIPSASNVSGTLIGTIAGALATSYLSQAAFMVGIAGMLGITPVALAGAVGIGVTALVNLLATHVAEIQNLNEVVKNFYPQIQYSYPDDPKPSTTQGAPNTNINQQGG